MNARTLTIGGHVAGWIGAHLQHRAPGARAGCPTCPEAGHTFPERAVDRHQHGVELCPLCSARIRCEHLADGRLRVPTHRRLSSVTVRTVGR